FIQLADPGIKQAESRWQSRAVHFQRRQNFAKLPARKIIRELQHQPLRPLDRRQERIHSLCPHFRLSLFISTTNEAIASRHSCSEGSFFCPTTSLFLNAGFARQSETPHLLRLANAGKPS